MCNLHECIAGNTSLSAKPIQAFTLLCYLAINSPPVANASTIATTLPLDHSEIPTAHILTNDNIQNKTGLVDTGFAIEDPQEIIVYYRGVDATAFTVIADDKLYFRDPYPDKSEPFDLVVVHKRTRQIRFKARYWHSGGNYTSTIANTTTTEVPQASEAVPADGHAANSTIQGRGYEVSRGTTDTSYSHFTRSGQIDISALSSLEDGSDIDERLTTQGGESDLLANFNISAGSNRLTTSVDLEAVHRSNAEHTVRFNGPRADLSLFRSSISHTSDDGTSFYLKAGDIEVSSANSLVNGGMASRGFSIGFATANDRFSWEVGRVFGQDIVGTVKGPIGFSDESYRIGAKTGFRLVDKESIRVSGRLSVLNVKRTAGDSFAVAESQSGEVNNVWGLGTDIELFNNRLNLSLSWAGSKYDNPRQLNSENLPDDPALEIFNPGITRGRAYRHSMQWQAWQSDDFEKEVSLQLVAERADPFYRSVHGDATADRRQWSLYAEVTNDNWNARIGTTQYRNNLDNLISIHTLDETLHTADITFNLGPSFGDNTDANKSANWVPTSIGFSASVESLETLNGDQIILAPVIAGFDFMNQVTETLGLSLNWDSSNTSTSLTIDHTFLDNSQRERATADTRSLDASITHSIYKDNWSLSARLGLSGSDDFDIASRSSSDFFEWGLSGSYTTSSGAMWTAAVDSSIDNFNDLMLDDSEESRTLAYSASLDVGLWLAQRLSWRAEPSVTLAWQQFTSDTNNLYFKSDQTSESLTINVGVPF